MTPTTWALLLGVILTVAATWLKKATWSTQMKVIFVVILAGLLSVAQDVVTILAGGESLTLGRILVDAGIIFATASTFYTTIWEKIENKIKPPV